MRDKKNKSSQNKITLREVAKEAGVSVATVSYVLNDTGSVGDVVKRRVRNAVKKLGYRPNQSAQAMKTGRTRTIGLILPDLTNPFFPELAQSIERTARENGYSVLLFDAHNSEEAEKEGIEHLFRQQVDGFIWCPRTANDIIAERVPVVLVDRPMPNYDSVLSNYVSGGIILADYLLSRGHNKIGMVLGPQNLESARLRRQGFVDAISGKASIVWEVENEFSLEICENALEHILAKDVSVIVAANDVIAIGVMSALKNANISIPDDISVVGFDDIPWCSIVSPSLTSIRQPLTQIGREAMNTLLYRIDNPDSPKRRIEMDVDLVSRESVKNLQ